MNFLYQHEMTPVLIRVGYERAQLLQLRCGGLKPAAWKTCCTQQAAKFGESHSVFAECSVERDALFRGQAACPERQGGDESGSASVVPRLPHDACPTKMKSACPAVTGQSRTENGRQAGQEKCRSCKQDFHAGRAARVLRLSPSSTAMYCARLS